MPRKQAKKKAAKRIPICPECGSASVIPVIHGVATLEIQRALQAGKAILADVRRHAAGRAQNDDITLMVFGRTADEDEKPTAVV